MKNEQCPICGSWIPRGGLTFHKLIKHGGK